jgi:hypothetical protein
MCRLLNNSIRNVQFGRASYRDHGVGFRVLVGNPGFIGEVLALAERELGSASPAIGKGRERIEKMSMMDNEGFFIRYDNKQPWIEICGRLERLGIRPTPDNDRQPDVIFSDGTRRFKLIDILDRFIGIMESKI